MNLINITRPFTNLPQLISPFLRTAIKWAACGLFLTCFLTHSAAEGIKQVAPASTDIVMLMSSDPIYANFAAYNSVATSRLHINISNPSTENVHLGLSQLADATGALTTTTYYVRIKDPLGNIVYGPQAINNTNANANTWALASAGPSTVVGASGYAPFTYTPAVGAPAGDYYIEFSDNSTANSTAPLLIKYWDITVATRTVPTAIDGRIWSKKWAYRTPTINAADPTYGAYDRPFNGYIHTYSDDGFVNKLDFLNSGFRGLSFNFAFNSTGTATTGNIIADRKSIAGDAALPQYKIFLSNPDPSVYPSGAVGSIPTTPFVLDCATNPSPCIAYSTTLPGLIQVLLDFNSTSGAGIYDPGTADVLMYETVTPTLGEVAPYKRCVNWNGKNGLGGTMPKGAPVPIYLTYIQGVVHFPVYDVEYNTAGFTVTPIRPTPSIGHIITLKYDDTNIAAASGSADPVSNVYTGVAPPYHRWTNFNFGDVRTINTWWFGSQVNKSSFTLPVIPTCDFTGAATVCPATSNIYSGAAGQDTYAWSITGNGVISGASNAQNVSVTAGASGTYTLTLTTTLGGCALTCNQIVTVGLTATITGTNSTCATTTGLTYTATAGMTTYAWTLTGNGTITSASNAQNVTVNAGGTGSFTLNLTVTGNGGACSAMTSKIVTVTNSCSVNKYLYLSDPSQALDRTDPVAANDLTTAQTTTLSTTATGVVLDATTTGTTLTTTGTVAHTTGTGLNRLMLVGVSLRPGDNENVTSVTYGGVALTQVGTALQSNRAKIYIFRLLNPNSGAANVVVNFDNATDKGAVIGVTTYSGVNQTTPLGAFSSATGLSTTASVNVTSAANELVFAVAAVRTNLSVTQGAGQTERWDAVSAEIDGVGSTKVGAATSTNSWTFTFLQDWAIGGVSIKPEITTTNVVFTENPVLCSDLTMPSGSVLTVQSYVSISNGTMPTNPNITAVVKYGATTITSQAAPTYDSATGLLTWTMPALGSTVTVPAGQAIVLDITTAQAGVSFNIDYDSKTKPSKITIPVSTFINITNLSVYSAAYPSGTVITTAAQGSNAYVRVTVTDPFGATDISSVNLTVTDPSSGVTLATLTNPQIVGTTACGSIYQYKITGLTQLGTWSIQAVANEGTEGVTANALSNFTVVTSLTPPLQTKELYLSDPSQSLDRIDPRTTADATVATTPILAAGSLETIAVDATSSGFSLTNSVTLAHITGTGSNRLMLVGISIRPNDNETVTSVTYGGVGLTQVGTIVNGNDALIYIYRLLNPTSGTADVVVTANEIVQRGMVVGVTTFTGVNQTTPLGTFASAISNTSTPSVSVTSAAGELIFDVVALKNNALSGSGGGQTQLWDLFSTADIYGASSTKAGAASTTMSWTGAGSSQWAMGAVPIKQAVITPNTTSTFTQAPTMCSPLTVKGSETVTVTAYVNVLTGVMPTNPSIPATLKYGATTIVTLGAPTYNSGAGTLTWTGVAPPAGVTIPAGQAVVFEAITAQAGVTFQIEYDAVSKPSKIDLPTETYIDITNFAFYNAPYPSGTVITNYNIGATVYARAVVTDPFGSSDITALNLDITAPNGAITMVSATSVATSGCTRTYEYAWIPPSVGDYNFNAIAKEGTENTVADFATAPLAICPPTITAAVTTIPTCTDPASGVIDYSVAGGNGPYTYNWTMGATTGNGVGTSITGLLAGTYNITVTTAGGCSGTATLVVPVPVAPTLSRTFTDITCNSGTNGAIDLSVSGGVTPYIYYWQDGNTDEDRTGLFANTWNVTVTGGNGCTATTATTLTEPTAISIMPTTTNVNCNGGTTGAISLAVSGGVGTYTYAWEDATTTQNRTGLTAGTYAVTVTDLSNCSNSRSYAITQPDVLSATHITTALTCSSKGTINVSVVGGTLPYTYDWADIAGTSNTKNRIGLSAGMYNLTVTDGKNCTAIISETFAPIVCNLPPVPINDYTTTQRNTTKMGTVATNDSDPDNTAAQLTWSTTATISPLQGTLTMLPTGAYTFIPATNFTGTVVVNYQVCDLEPVCRPATLTIEVAIPVQDTVCLSKTNDVFSVTPDPDVTNYTWSASAGVVIVSGQGTPSVIIDWSGSTTGYDSICITTTNICGTSAKIFYFVYKKQVIPTATATMPCMGGTIQLNATGGLTAGLAGGTSYAWTGPSGFTSSLQNPIIYNATVANAGTYTVVVTDTSGCVGTTNVAATLKTPPSVSGVSTNTTCNGGTSGAIDMTVAGGTAPYTYTWSNANFTEDIMGLSAGAYTVTVTSTDGCTATTTFNVNENSSINLTIAATDVACLGQSNGAINLTATSGTSPYTFSWSNGATTEDVSSLPVGTYSVTVTDAALCNSIATATLTEPNALSANGTPTQVGCNGGNNGAITLQVTGGTAPFTYNWGGGMTTQDRSNLTAGTYTVTVTDANNCTAIYTTIITQPAVLSLSTALSPVDCNGGANGVVNLSIAGGTSPYTFVWSNGATTEDINNLLAGTYTVTVTDNKGCTATISAIITQPNALTLTNVTTNATCNGSTNGAINLTIAGGTPPLSILWSNSATTEDLTAIAAGTYRVTVTDANACSATASIAVTQPAALNATLTPTNNTCNGASTGSIATVPTGGTTPYTYLWLSGQTTQNLTNIAAGTYSLTVTDVNNCKTIASAIVTEPTAIALTALTTNVLCNGGSTGAINLTATGGMGALTYNWGGGITIEDRTGLTIGTYTVTVTDGNACTATQTFTISQPTPLSLAVAPINATCNGAASNGSVNLTVSNGVAPYTFSWSNGATTEDISNLGAGTFLVTVTDVNNCVATISTIITQPAALVTTLSVTNVLCFGNNTGSITTTTIGGTPPYNFAWSNGNNTANATNLTIGSYTLTLTDANGCSTTTTRSITQPTGAIAVVGTVTDVLCFSGNNGGISLTITEGVSPYTFAWSNGAITQNISTLIAGNYTITVTDANLCTAIKTFTITEPTDNLALSLTKTDARCSGNADGSINVTASGGTLPYTYIWSNGQIGQDISNLIAGTYTLTVTDAHNCTATTSTTLTQPTPIILSSTVIDADCNGGTNGSINLIVSGGVTPYLYSWSNGTIIEDISGVSAGNYSVTVTGANSCSATLMSIAVSEASSIAVTPTVLNNNCVNGNQGAINLVVSGGVAPLSYSWSNGATTKDIGGLTAGAYTLAVKDAINCVKIFTFTITQPSGTPLALSSVITQSNCGAATGAIDLTATGGVTPHAYAWSNGATTQDIGSLNAGIYAVSVTDANGCVQSSSNLVNDNAALTLTSTVTNILCNGGSSGMIALTISGGTTPYTYNWSNSTTAAALSGVGAGAYSVSVTDANNCRVFTTQTITQPTTLTLITAKNNPTCTGSNGMAFATPSGGTAPYTYNWSNTAATASISGLTPAIYTVTITDAQNCLVNGSVTLTAPSCVPPIAGNDAFGTPTNTPITQTVATNDSDPDGLATDLIYNLITQPTLTQGTIVFNHDGTFTFTPTTGFAGVVVLTYEVCDLSNLCTQATLTITILPNTPKATFNTQTTLEDTPINIAVITNDTFGLEGPSATAITITSNAAHGTATVNTNGTPNDPTDDTIDYAPNLNFNGKDSLIYQICDASGDCDTAIVYITITPVNDPPVANLNSIIVTEDTPLSINVLSNDTDLDGTIDPTSVTITVQPVNGTVTVDPITGILTYTPKLNFVGKDSLIYRVCDNGTPVLCDTAIVYINVLPVNDPPVAIIDSIIVTEDTPLSINVLSNDTDLDGTIDPTSVIITVQPVNGTVTVDPITGILTYTPKLNFVGKDSLIYRVCDNGTPVLCDTAIVYINVLPVNDPPVANFNTGITPEGTSLNINILSNDTDIDGAIDPASVIIATQPFHGTVVVNPITGLLTYTPDSLFNGKDSLVYRVCDNGTPLPAQCDTAIVYLTVTGVNHTPVANVDAATTNEDTPVVVNILSNDVDSDSNLDPSTVTITAAPLHGTVTINPVTGAITYTPNPNFNGKDSLIYRVCDSGNPMLCDTAKVFVTVKPVNDPPIANFNTGTTPEATPLSINILVNDTDVDGLIDPTSVTISTQPLHGTIAVDPNTGLLTYTPNALFSGRDSLIYRVCDNGTPVLCDTAIVYINVSPVNHPPVVTRLDTITVLKDSTRYVCTTIADRDTGDRFTAMRLCNPTKGTVSTTVVGNQLCLTYTANNGTTGADSVCIKVCDASGACDTVVFRFKIPRPNDTIQAVSIQKRLAVGQPINNRFGSVVNYTISVRNNGNFPMTNVDVRDSIPVGMAFNAANPLGWVYDSVHKVATTIIPRIAVGETVPINISLVLVYGNPGSSVRNRAQVFCALGITNINIIDSTNIPNDTAVIMITPYDPIGNIYSENTGILIKGGHIELASAPAGGIIYFAVAANGDTLDGRNGTYQFYTNGVPGIYTIKYVNPLGFALSPTHLPRPTALTPTNNDGDITDANGDGVIDRDSLVNGFVTLSTANVVNNYLTDYSAATNPYYLSFNIKSGDPFIDKNNLPVRASTLLGAHVAIDANENGLFEDGEIPVGNVLVYLYDDKNPTVIIDSTRTTNSGTYLFDGLSAGTYHVRFSLPNNYRFTRAHDSTNQYLNSDADTLTGLTGSITLGWNQKDSTLSALYIAKLPPTITGDTVSILRDSSITLCLPIQDDNVNERFTSALCGVQHGTVTQKIVGRTLCFTYTPFSGYVGKDTLCLSVCDRDGLCDTTSVVITVKTSCSTVAPILVGVPANTTVDCSAVPTRAAVTEQNGGTVVFAEVRTNGSCSNTYLLTRTWSSTNVCGLRTTAAQTITIEDKTAPIISNIPANITVDCANKITVATPSVSDACDANPSLILTEITSDSTCLNHKMITRLWLAKDACGNASTASQTIVVNDNIAPIIRPNNPLLAGFRSGDTLTVNCESIRIFQLGDATVTDNCTNCSPTVRFEDLAVRQSICAVSGYSTLLECRWVATDCCGNTAEWRILIKVIDNKPPVLKGVPENTTVNSITDIPSLPIVTATDNCTDNLRATFTESRMSTGTNCDFILNRTWTAVDACGNITRRTQLILVRPTLANCCPHLLAQDSVIITNACSDSTKVCVNIPTDDIPNYTIRLNGAPYAGRIEGCKFDTILNYTYFSVPDRGRTPPYTLDYWMVNGVQFRADNITSLQALVDTMNHFDPMGNWRMRDSTMNICGGNMQNTYGDMKLTKVSNGAYGILRLNRNRLPTATNLMVLRGRSTLAFTNLLTGCTDSLVVNAACVTPQRIENTLLKGKLDTLYLDTRELIGSQFKIRTLQNGSDRYVHFTNVAGTVGISRQTMNVGTDDITYVVTDEYGISDTTYLITHVTEAAFRTQRPVALDDTAETSKLKAIYLNVMTNDTLFTNNATMTIITEPKRGTAIVMPDLSVLYTPNPDCNTTSSDVFRYILCNQAGCDTATVAVTVACDKLKICNGFSPNNDGVNDYFIIEGVENYPKNVLTIYNRWGTSILDVKGYKNDWSSTWNGQVVPDGTYFYLFNDGEGNQQTGYIQIQR